MFTAFEEESLPTARQLKSLFAEFEEEPLPTARPVNSAFTAFKDEFLPTARPAKPASPAAPCEPSCPLRSIVQVMPDPPIATAAIAGTAYERWMGLGFAVSVCSDNSVPAGRSSCSLKPGPIAYGEKAAAQGATFRTMPDLPPRPRRAPPISTAVAGSPSQRQGEDVYEDPGSWRQARNCWRHGNRAAAPVGENL